MPQLIPFARPMTRAGRAQVFAAADRALLAGARPTQDGIRRDLGGGSLGSINTYLNEWYRELGPRLSAAESPSEGVPAEASALLHQLWRLAQGSVQRAEPSDLDRSEQLIQDAERTALQAQNKALEILNAELQRHRLSAERSLVDVRALSARREAALEDERGARLQAEQELARLRMEFEVLKERRAVRAVPVAPAVVRRIVRKPKRRSATTKVSAKRASVKKSQKRPGEKQTSEKRTRTKQATRSTIRTKRRRR